MADCLLSRLSTPGGELPAGAIDAKSNVRHSVWQCGSDVEISTEKSAWGKERSIEASKHRSGREEKSLRTDVCVAGRCAELYFKRSTFVLPHALNEAWNNRHYGHVSSRGIQVLPRRSRA